MGFYGPVRPCVEPTRDGVGLPTELRRRSRPVRLSQLNTAANRHTMPRYRFPWITLLL